MLPPRSDMAVARDLVPVKRASETEGSVPSDPMLHAIKEGTGDSGDSPQRRRVARSSHQKAEAR